MAKKFIIFICVAILFHSVCKKDSLRDLNSEYLIFGRFYGFCLGEKCIQMFKITSNRLYKDNLKKYPNNDNFYEGKFLLLSQKNFDEAKTLLALFPPQLLTEPKNIIGEPDATDGGGLYIEYNFGNIRKFWLMDQLKQNVPDRYHYFMDSVNIKIERLE